jgi:FAD/FMN-containing dehydrogenase
VTRREVIQLSIGGMCGALGASTFSGAAPASRWLGAVTQPAGGAADVLITDNEIRDLQRHFAGRVIRPGDEEYDAARRVWNSSIDRRPSLIVRPRSARDVGTAVRFARSRDLPLAVRGGGHNLTGYGTVDRGLLVEFPDMKRLRVDAGRGIAWAEPGLTWGEYGERVQADGFMTPAGDTASVGIPGLTLGGGLGWLTRKDGLTIDHLRSVDLITADGEHVTANADDHRDLFWALRGGGGNFGIVTGFEFGLVPLGTIIGGAIFYPATAATLRDYVASATEAPEAVGTIAFVMPAPPLPFLPPEVHGKTVLFITVCYAGPLESGDQALASLRALGGMKPIADTTAPTAYTSLWDLTKEGAVSRAHVVRSGFLRAFDETTLNAVLQHCNNPTSPMSVAQLRVLGGAMARVPADATAFWHRDKPLMLTIINAWDADPNVPAEPHIAWADSFWQAVAPQTDGTYSNFLQDEDEERIRAAYPPETYARLVEVKRRYDPENIFRLNVNIRPA